MDVINRHLWMRGGFALLVLVSAPVRADAALGADELIDFPLEALMQMDATVTSASKRNETLKDTPSAIYVLSREDIRRSPATTIPDALRMVPGLDVGQISASEWSVSARGLGGRFARYLLVLIDGRSLYTSLFSGINWDELNLSLENIEQIEVIRGPGGSMWGANAVNGVINIITRKPELDASAQLRVTAGEGHESYSLFGRKDFALGHKGHAFVSADMHRMEPLEPVKSDLRSDGIDSGRMDAGWAQELDNQSLSITAAAWQVNTMVPWTKQLGLSPWQSILYSEENKTGYYLSTRWTHAAGVGEWYLLLNADDARRDTTAYRWNTANYDAEWQWSGELIKKHTVTMGVFTRLTRSLFEVPANGLDVIMSPAQKTLTTRSAYIQDSIAIASDWLLALSWRLDNHSLSSSATQPSINLLWRATDHHRLWASASKSVSTPSRVLNSKSTLSIQTLPPQNDLPFPVRVDLINDGQPLEDAVLTAYELGYRYVPSSRFSLDTTAFSHHYEHLVSAEQTVTPAFLQLGDTTFYHVQFKSMSNKRRVNNGVELSATYSANPSWMLQYSGAYLQVDYGEPLKGISPAFRRVDEAPEWQHSLRSLWNMNADLNVDFWLRYVDELPRTSVKRYVALDAKTTWQLNKDWALSLTGRNLTKSDYAEGSREIFNVSDYWVGRSFFLKAVWMPQ